MSMARRRRPTPTLAANLRDAFDGVLSEFALHDTALDLAGDQALASDTPNGDLLMV